MGRLKKYYSAFNPPIGVSLRSSTTLENSLQAERYFLISIHNGSKNKVSQLSKSSNSTITPKSVLIESDLRWCNTR